MLQDIEPEKLNNSYLQLSPDDDSFLIFIQEQRILLQCTEKDIHLPLLHQVKDRYLQTTYLLSVGNHRFFLVEHWEQSEGSAIVDALREQGYEFHDNLSFLNHGPRWLCFAAAAAYQLGNWYIGNRFCSKCGNILKKGEKERHLYCEYCNNKIYPRLNPAVIAGVIHNDRILLTKYRDTAYNERYAMIAGYAEVGETIEETVRREVMEETGVSVKNIRYYCSQPWPLTDTLLLGFFCELEGSAEIKMDANELSAARWMARDEIPEKEDDGSITYEMIMRFKRNEI